MGGHGCDAAHYASGDADPENIEGKFLGYYVRNNMCGGKASCPCRVPSSEERGLPLHEEQGEMTNIEIKNLQAICHPAAAQEQIAVSRAKVDLELARFIFDVMRYFARVEEDFNSSTVRQQNHGPTLPRMTAELPRKEPRAP